MGQAVLGHHLVRAAVANGVAEVYVTGQGEVDASNPLAYNFESDNDYWDPLPGDLTYSASAASASLTATAKQDDRAVTLHRDGARPKLVLPDGSIHNEWTGNDGVTHGDTTYSYDEWSDGLDNSTQVTPRINHLIFHPSYSGGWNFLIYGMAGSNPNITSTWNPLASNDVIDQGASDVGDWAAIYGGLTVDNGVWTSDPSGLGVPESSTGIQQRIISYTATDIIDEATETATYVISLHDPLENFRRVDSSGNPLSLSAPGDPGDIVQVGQNSTNMPSAPVVTVTDKGVDWNVVGETGGGILEGTGVVLTEMPETPTWVSQSLYMSLVWDWQR